MYVRVDVTAGARRETVMKTGPDSFAAFVREKAERNMANRRVMEIIRGQFGTEGVMVKIISGYRSHRKILNVEIGKPSVGGNE